ncbi:hypothetical protein [Streptomyces griseorubiginosus]|uniref:hypothetical protein n=1 Tax=Streptomyces griseorubiginosus TaxID=67304 RepID=UPI002E80A28E|nr:hypothetical protein [Streptomyces griseorubiginosus]WUB43246.1 hypothetical protein OHN19_07830 [Streptomyces griseorubiginosus]WUB51764.1 hypothetical protein OG942_07825 [Streptomyces griseorubiginosus]
MRRTARLRALSVVLPALGITLGVAAPSAFADPAAEVSPSSVQPGGSVTVSVSCDPGGGTPPATLDATSEAFETETVRLQLVTGNEDAVSGPAYSGTARVSTDPELQDGAGGVGPDSAWTVDGTCPTADRAPGKAWSATFTVTRGTGTGTGTATDSGGRRPCAEPSVEPYTEPRTETRSETCATAVIQRPVRAGQGGSFTDSVPALVTGGLLIAGAAAGAVYRLRRRTPAGPAAPAGDG